jgi:hypothetical protein
MAHPYVHIWLAGVEPQTVDRAVAIVRKALEQALPVLGGLKSASVLLAEDRRHVAVVTEWEGPHDWGRAQWETHIQDAIVALFRTARHVDSHTYGEVFHYPSSS